MENIENIANILYVIMFMGVIGSLLNLLLIFVYMTYTESIRTDVKEIGEMVRKNSDSIHLAITKIEHLEKKFFIKRKSQKKNDNRQSSEL